MSKIPFAKHATTYTQQITQLTTRGMVIADRGLAERWLKTVGYYRLGAYWLTFENPPTNCKTRSKVFETGTKFEDIIDLYTFDRELRLLVTEAIERTEIALRASWTYHMVNKYGAHAYLQPTEFTFDLDYHQQVGRSAQQFRRSSETFVTHYRDTYYPPALPPMWIATELMTFGELSIWVAKTRNNAIKTDVARDMGLGNIEILTGTVQSLSYVRNICAHHARLWNRRLVKRPPHIGTLAPSLLFAPKGQNVVDNSIYNILTFLVHLLRKQSPDTSFAERITDLIDSQPAFVARGMGVPADFKTRPIWTPKP